MQPNSFRLVLVVSTSRFIGAEGYYPLLKCELVFRFFDSSFVFYIFINNKGNVRASVLKYQQNITPFFVFCSETVYKMVRRATFALRRFSDKFVLQILLYKISDIIKINRI